jgi:hypothetical protein
MNKVLLMPIRILYPLSKFNSQLIQLFTILKNSIIDTQKGKSHHQHTSTTMAPRPHHSQNDDLEAAGPFEDVDLSYGNPPARVHAKPKAPVYNLPQPSQRRAWPDPHSRSKKQRQQRNWYCGLMTGKQAFWWTVMVIVLGMIMGLSINAANKANAQALYHAAGGAPAPGGNAPAPTPAAAMQCGGF